MNHQEQKISLRNSNVVNLICKNEVILAANKNNLLNNSSIFRYQIVKATLEHKICLQLNYNDDIVTQMLNFFESDNVKFDTLEKAIELFKLSQSYEIVKLKRKCRKYLLKKLSIRNVCGLHDLAYEANDQIIQYNCWKMFDRAAESIFITEDFMNCSVATVFRLVSRPISTIRSELYLFLGIYEWACRRNERSEFRQNIRFYMSPFLPRIRFLSMDRSDLEQVVFLLNVLNQEEIQSIRDYKEKRWNGSMKNFPKMISKNSMSRIPATYYSLFEYKNRKLTRKRSRKLNDKNYFKSEFIVKEDCFLISIQIPIDYSGDKKLNVVVNFTTHDISSEYAECDNSGNIFLRRPKFICRCNQSHEVEVQIPSEERLNHPDIKVRSNSDLYLANIQKKYRFLSRKFYRIKINKNGIFMEVTFWF
ncbi:uncharacterized protein [Centruroides vittatus]|uniref:uncharacterized protein n=1 Tax=Centruroides vittatus TaxID=120091 RepID=UPI00350F4C02